MRFLVLLILCGASAPAATIQFSGLMHGLGEGPLPTWDDWVWPGPTPLEGLLTYQRDAYNRPAADPAPTGEARLGPITYNRVTDLQFNRFGWLEQFTYLAEGVVCNSHRGPGDCELLVGTRYFLGPNGPPVWRALTQTRLFTMHNVATGFHTRTDQEPLVMEPMPTPEPGTVVLMGLGLLGLGVLRARRR